MNINPRGKQKKLHDTKIPLNNLGPAPSKEDTCGHAQSMCFPDDHSNPTLRGQPKGIRVILEEHKSIWDKFTLIHRTRNHTKLVGKGRSCTKLQLCKDAECHIALADAMG